MCYCRACSKIKYKEWSLDNEDYNSKRFFLWSREAKGRFSRYKKQAKKDKRDFKISFEDFATITSNKCYYCDEYEENTSYVGIDRLDSKVGYILDNCLPCCRFCNVAKNYYTKEHFIQKCKKIIKKLGDNFV